MDLHPVSILRVLRYGGVGFLLALVAPLTARASMEIQGLDTGATTTANYDRFENSPSFIGNAFNWSGVGQAFKNNGDPGYWATMISPSYFISANHANPVNDNDDSLRFYHSNDPGGAFEEYQNHTLNPSASNYFTMVTQIVDPSDPSHPTDLWLGKLSTPVSNNVTKYPILSLPSNSSFGGKTILTFGGTNGTLGRRERLGRNQIDPGSISQNYSEPSDPAHTVFNGITYRFDFDRPAVPGRNTVLGDGVGVGPDESGVHGGDSGAPNFMVVNNTLPSIVGLNFYAFAYQANSGEYTSAGDGTVSAYSGATAVFKYLPQLQAAMAGSGEQPSILKITSFSGATFNPLKGDFNLDGVISKADLDSMLQALTNPADYEALHGIDGNYLQNMGDLDNDGSLNNADIQKMLTLIAAAGAPTLQAVPEPATLVLLGLGVWPCWRWVRRNSRRQS